MNGAYYPNANYQGDMNLNNAPIGNDVDNEQSYIENGLRHIFLFRILTLGEIKYLKVLLKKLVKII